MQELTVRADLSNLDTVVDFVNSVLEEADVFPKTVIQMDVAIDELFTNVASYAYAPDTGDVTVQVRLTEENVEVTFRDSGVPYNPWEKADPDTTLSAEERPIGGLGIFMVKKTMDSMDYRYENRQNVVTIRKNR